ncbi:hypothetical protein C0J52_24644 [Blattella germanica]|nr:hypothetical protein C0J52_24644 [Blattella germanica]
MGRGGVERDGGGMVGVAPLSKNDPPKIIFQDASVKPVKQSSSPYSSSASGLYSALKKKQQIFQGGPMDRALFGVTLALCAVGLVGSLHTLYVMAYPKKA